MKLPVIKHLTQFIEENDQDYIIETIEVLEAMTEIASLKDEELDVIGELISNMYGALEVNKLIKDGADKKEALNPKLFVGYIALSKSLKDKIAVYPNPVEDHVYISSTKQPLSSVKVYDLLGVLIYEAQLEQNRQVHQIPIDQLKAGMYFLMIQSDNGEIAKRKIQKK